MLIQRLELQHIEVYLEPQIIFLMIVVLKGAEYLFYDNIVVDYCMLVWQVK